MLRLLEGIRKCSRGGWNHVVHLTRFAVAVGDSSGLAHVASPARVILCAVCSSAAVNAAQPHWPRTTEPVAKLECLS